MGNKFTCKLVAMLLLIATMVTALPLTVLAEMTGGSVEQETYVKSVKVAQADTAEEAKLLLEADGYTFLEGNPSRLWETAEAEQTGWSHSDRHQRPESKAVRALPTPQRTAPSKFVT